MFSLICATLGRTGALARLFDSLVAQTGVTFEVVVVDQNEGPVLDDILARYADALALVRVRTTPGLSRARNHGVAAARHPILGFPDDDCWFPAGVLAHVAALLADPALDGVTGRCLDEALNLAAGAEDRATGLVTSRNVWGRGVSTTMFLRRAALERAGGFDEALGLGAATSFQAGEETDLMLRIIAGGGRVLYAPDLIVHHAGPDARAPGAARRAWAYGLGMGRVLAQNHTPRALAARHAAQPLAGALVALATGRLALAHVRVARALGRWRGWRAQADETDVRPPRWLGLTPPAESAPPRQDRPTPTDSRRARPS